MTCIIIFQISFSGISCLFLIALSIFFCRSPPSAYSITIHSKQDCSSKKASLQAMILLCSMLARMRTSFKAFSLSLSFNCPKLTFLRAYSYPSDILLTFHTEEQEPYHVIKMATLPYLIQNGEVFHQLLIMSKEINTLQNIIINDPLLDAALNRPPRHQHFAIHPKEHDSFATKVAATRDIFYQEHFAPVEFASAVIKGAIFGGSVSFATYLSAFADPQQYTLRKLYNASEKQRFGHFTYTMKYASKFFLGGAAAGGAWHLWWNYWTEQGQDKRAVTYMSGVGIFLAAASVFIHPRYAPTSFVAGMGLGTEFLKMLGLFYLQAQKANPYETQTGLGFNFRLGGLTDEQREEQKIKDQIFYLGQCHDIKDLNRKYVEL